jgi:glycosyltransferase involved in cell wall biosynthesis
VHKILFLLSNFRTGGAERQYFNLIHGIDKQRFEIHVGLILYRNNKPSPALLASLIDVPVVLFERKHALDFSVIWKIYRYVDRNRMDIIQSLLFMDNQIGRLAGFLSGKLVITSIRGEILPLLGRVKTWFEYQMQLLSKKVVVNSNWLKDYLVEHGSRPDKIMVIHNGTEAENFKCDTAPLELRRKYGFPENVPIMGIVARLHPMKDHYTFLNAVKIVKSTLPDVHAIVVGDGEMMESLKVYVKDLALEKNVIFLGSITEGLPEIYRMINVLLLTSQYGESFPNVILEAMAASVPVVSTNISAVSEIIIEEQNGFIVDKKNAELLAKRTLRVLSDLELRNKFIRNGLARVEEFGVNLMVEKYEQLYEDVLGAP